MLTFLFFFLHVSTFNLVDKLCVFEVGQLPSHHPNVVPTPQIQNVQNVNFHLQSGKKHISVKFKNAF